MRRLLIATALAALGSGSALAQDAPPPGCRWMGDGNMACKDGKGYWRRSGDGQVVGTYSVAKPKPKPKPAPAVAVAPAPVAAAAPPAPVAPSAPMTPPEPAPAAPPPAAVQAETPAAEPATAAESPAPTIAPAEVQAPKSWWRRWLDDIKSDFQALLRFFGLGK